MGNSRKIEHLVPPATVGARVRRIRMRQGMSIRQIAAMAGVGKNTVSRIEDGNPTTLATLERVCAALGVQVAEIASEDQPSTWVLQKEAETVFNPDLGFDGEPDPMLATAPGERAKRRAMVPAVASVFDAALANLPTGRLNCTKIELYGPRKPIAHPGEEFVLCVKGRLQVRVGKDLLELAEGDSASFWSSEIHAYAPAPDLPERELPVEILIVWVAS